MPTRLVIFDCDGVLVDSERLGVRLEATVLAELGWRLSEEEIIRRFVGRSEEYMRGEIRKRLGSSLPDGWEELFGSRYRDVFERELRPVEGIAEALEAIQHHRCVASSTAPEGIRWRLGLTGLSDHFGDNIFSVTQVANGKPAPDIFLFAAQQMGYDAAACAVVEDSRWGVQAARAAGMRVLAYAGGLTPASDLDGPGTVVFHDMRELPALLGKP